MDTIFMDSKNSKIFDPHRILLNLSNKIDLKRCDKYDVLSNLRIYYAWKNKKQKKNYTYKINKFKISAPTWNDKYELLDRS